MPLFTFPLPPGIDPLTLDAASVDAYFAGKGYAVVGSSVRVDGTVSVNLDRNPSADLAAFAPVPTATQTATAQAVSALRAYLTNVRAVAPALRTPEQTAILAVATILKSQLGQ